MFRCIPKEKDGSWVGSMDDEGKPMYEVTNSVRIFVIGH